MPIRDQESFARPGPARVRFLCNRGANGIDGLISSGVGAAAASGCPSWIIVGDLGLHHDANGLAGVQHVPGPVRVVVINNDGGGIFEFLPQSEQIERSEFEALLGTPREIDPARIAAAHGLRHTLVDDLDRLGAAAGQTGVIEIRTDRRRNVHVHQRIADRVAAALAAARGA